MRSDALGLFTSPSTGAAVYVAAVQRETDQLEASLATLSGAVEEDPESAQLLIAMGNECLYAGQVCLSTVYKIPQFGHVRVGSMD